MIKTRFSCSKIAGIERTLVAVGTVRLASMFVTTRAATPFNGSVIDSFGSSLTTGAEGGVGTTGSATIGVVTTGVTVDWAGLLTGFSCGV